MLHGLKTPAALAVSLLMASACASDATDIETSPVIAERAAPTASPVDLDLLALLATQASTPGVAVTRTVPTHTRSAADWKIIPAKSSTFVREAPIKPATGINYGTEPLLTVPHDSDLLRGPVYDSSAARKTRGPIVTAGTFRTIEYKN